MLGQNVEPESGLQVVRVGLVELDLDDLVGDDFDLLDLGQDRTQRFGLKFRVVDVVVEAPSDIFRGHGLTIGEASDIADLDADPIAVRVILPRFGEPAPELEGYGVVIRQRLADLILHTTPVDIFAENRGELCRLGFEGLLEGPADAVVVVLARIGSEPGHVEPDDLNIRVADPRLVAFGARTRTVGTSAVRDDDPGLELALQSGKLLLDRVDLCHERFVLLPASVVLSHREHGKHHHDDDEHQKYEILQPELVLHRYLSFVCTKPVTTPIGEYQCIISIASDRMPHAVPRRQSSLRAA